MSMKDFRGNEPTQGPAHDRLRALEAQRPEEVWYRGLGPEERLVVDRLTDSLRALHPGAREAASLYALRKANQRPKPKPGPLTPEAAKVKVNLSGAAWLHAEGMNEPVFIPAESAEEYRREYASLKAIGKQPKFWVSDPIRQHEQGS